MEGCRKWSVLFFTICSYEEIKQSFKIDLSGTQHKWRVNRFMGAPSQTHISPTIMVTASNPSHNFGIMIPMISIITYRRLILYDLHRAKGAGIQILAISGHILHAIVLYAVVQGKGYRWCRRLGAVHEENIRESIARRKWQDEGEQERLNTKTNAANNKQLRTQFKEEQILNTIRIEDKTVFILLASARRNRRANLGIDKSWPNATANSNRRK